MSVEFDRPRRRTSILDVGIAAIETIPRPARRGLSIIALPIIWWILIQAEVLGFGVFVTPTETALALASYLAGTPMADGITIYHHAAYSAGRVVIGTTLAVSVAIPLGLVIGTRRRWDRWVFPALEFLRPIPPIAWVPLVLVLFPTTLSGVIFVVFLGAFFPTLINTIRGVESLEIEYQRAAASLGASDRKILQHVVLPSALPAIITGVSIGVGLGWITVVAAEMITAEYGLGHVVFQAYRLIDMESVVVGMITAGALGGLSTGGVALLGRRITPWQSAGGVE